MQNLKEGAPVRLVATMTPIMHIVSIDGNIAHCTWLHNGNQHTGDFPLGGLEPVVPPTYRGPSSQWTI